MAALTYLDTHVVAWLYAGDVERISARARRRIARSDVLLASPMVVLELQYLYETGRTREQAGSVMEDLHDRVGLELCGRPFAEIVAAAVREGWTRDPFDRVIVGHARLTQAPLVTKDEPIRESYRRAVW